MMINRCYMGNNGVNKSDVFTLLCISMAAISYVKLGDLTSGQLRMLRTLALERECGCDRNP